VVTYRAGYESLQKEAPGLITLYGLMAREVENTRYGSITSDSNNGGTVDGTNANAGDQVTQMMRRILSDESIQPTTWRLMCRVGTDWMKEFLAYYNFGVVAPCDIAADLLRLVQAFGTQGLVPPWLLHALMQTGGNPNDPRVGYTARLEDLFTLCKRLGHLMTQLDDKGLARLEEHAHALFNWASDHLGELPEAYLRRASLGGLIHRVELQATQEALALECAAGWHVPFSLQLKSVGVDAVILDNPLAIWQEGQVMRHCADKWIGPCAKGDYLMVSLRHSEKSRTRGRPLATVTFDLRGDSVRLHKIAGFANTLASPEAHDLAQDCLRQLRLQWQRQQLGKPLRQHMVAGRLQQAAA
jgi:hypothetical protein